MSGSLCKQSHLCSRSLAQCIWCLPAGVKLWTLLKHVFLTECIFKYYLAPPPLFVVVKFHIGGNCASTHFTSFVLLFLCNLDFCFRKLWSLVGVSMCDFFRVAEVPRIKSALQSHRLICWTLFLSSSNSMDSIAVQVLLIWLAYWAIAEVLPEESPP